MKNKLLSTFVILLLFIELILPAVTMATIADQTNIMKELFKVPADARLTRENNESGAAVTWSLEQNDDFSFGEATFNDEDGELLRYIEVYEAPKLPAEMKQDDCQRYIENIMSRMLPGKLAMIKLSAAPDKYIQEGNTLYHFSYDRIEGQIPVNGDGIYVIFDATTGRVLMMQLSWYNSPLPDQSGLISPQAAGKAFCTGVTLSLEWIRTVKGQGDLKFDLRPAYMLANDYAVNAKTGQGIESFPEEVLPYSFDINNKPIVLSPITPDNSLTASEAEIIARKGAQVPAQFTTLQSYALWAWGEQGRTREFLFTDEIQEKEIGVSVDIVSRQLTGINNYDYMYDEKTPQITYNSGLTTAQNLGRTLAPAEYMQTRINQKKLDYTYPAYEFIRYIYGIPYRDNSLQVELNEYTGELSTYYLTWERNLNLPNLTTIIDTARMRQVLAEKASMKLVYMITRDYSSDSTEITEKAELFYLPVNSMRVPYDAVSGSKVEQHKVPAGVAGNWSESSFRSLAELGIVNPNSPVNPNKPISRADFTKMLVLATYLYPKEAKVSNFSDVPSSSSYAGYIQQAYSRGIVIGSGGKFYPDRPIARQEVAVILVKALKSEKRIEDNIKIMPTSFSDKNLVAAWAANDVNLATQLGYIKGFNGFFRPTSNITWGEAAALLNNYIYNI